MKLCEIKEQFSDKRKGYFAEAPSFFCVDIPEMEE